MTDILEQLVDYSRQTQMSSELGHIHTGRHVIVGCGGIGYWLAIQLAMMGTTDITLIDADRVEPSNMNRLPVPMRLVGQYKVKTLKIQLRLLRPSIKVTCLPVHLTQDTMSMLQNISMVWDCTDDARIQKLLSAYCRAKRARYVKAGYEGFNVGAYSKMEDTWLQDGYTPGYTTNSSNVLSSMLAAGLAIMYAGINGNNYIQQNIPDMQINLKDLVSMEGR
jgi:hypothetical protein